MLVAGLALPYHTEMLDDTATMTVTTKGVTRTPLRRTMFYSGAFTDVLHEQRYVDVTLNHAHGQYLGSTRDGLLLFETVAGLYFYLRFPDTPFAKDVYRAVVDGKVRHVCACSSHDVGEEDSDLLFTVRRAALRSLSLLITAPAHFPQTWTAVAGPEAEARIDAETKAQEQRQFWALNPAVTAEHASDRPPGALRAS